MDELDQRTMYYSESAFYLSFFTDIVEARDWTDVAQLLIRDDRTEYPEVVVAFKRLNITQEIILGVLYRALRLDKIFSKPFNFYAGATLLLHALGVAILFALAIDLGDSCSYGLLFLGLYFSLFQHKLITRIMALPLRENFATPALWMSILCLRHLLEANAKDKDANTNNNSKTRTKNVVDDVSAVDADEDKGASGNGNWRMLLFVSWTWLMLSWQFSLQLLTMQLAILFGMNVIGLLPSRQLWMILSLVAGAFGCASCVMLFPHYYLFSIFSSVVVGIVSALYVIGCDGKHGIDFCKVAVQKIVVAASTTVAFHFILNVVSRPDGHVFDLLFEKFGLGKPTFDSVIYQLGSEYKPLPGFIYKMILETWLLYYFGIALVVVLVNLVLKRKDEANPTRPFTCYLLVQMSMFMALAVMVSRLRVLALPLMCIFSTFVLSLTNFEKVKHLPGRKILLYAIALAPFFWTIPYKELKHAPFGEQYNDASTKELVGWINRNVDPIEPILTDMPTSSVLRACTRNKLVVNPQYEYQPLRVKTWMYYNLGNCATEQWFAHAMLNWYHCRILIVTGRFCTIFEKYSPDVQNIQTLLRLNPLGYSCPDDAPYHKRLCNKLLVGQSYFDLIYSSGDYMVYRLKSIVPGAVVEPKWEEINSLATFKPWLQEHVSRDFVGGPFQLYKTFIFLKKNFQATCARQLLDYGMQTFPDDVKMLRYYAEALDYDYGEYEQAKEYYDELIGKSACTSIEDLDLYCHYIEFLNETRSGSVEDVIGTVSRAERCLEIDFKRKDSETICKWAVLLFNLFRSNSELQNLIIRNSALKFWNILQPSNTLALKCDDEGIPQYDLVVRQGLKKGQIMYTRPNAQKEKHFSSDQLAPPDDDKIKETINRTRQALEATMSRNKAANLHAAAATQANNKSAEIFRYTPNQTSHGAIKQRLIRIIEKQQDPLEPCKHRHKKLPAPAPEPQAPLQHSPPRKLTAEDQKAWKIPPCVSNWKNQNGYTIPIDKRVQADGRRLQNVYISGKHAQLSESLDIAVRTAREEVALRNQAQREEAKKQAEAKEMQLRQLAAQARLARQNINPNDEMYIAEVERKRELEREYRLEKAGKKIRAAAAAAQRNERRDISEIVALGQAKPTATTQLYDSRLVNTSAGIDSGFNAGEDENYNIYDKPLFADRSVAGIYQHSRQRLAESVGEASRVAAFANADKDHVRSTPVEFVKDTSDPFGFNTLLDKTKE